MKLQIPAGGLVIPLDGSAPPSVTVHVHFDVCPTWLEIAARHAGEAKERKAARVAAWNSTDEAVKGETLEREFEASMQAIMAAANRRRRLCRYAPQRKAMDIAQS